jgi:predicted  nucleic acid-binding Zn-ribbon protein
MTEDLTKRRSDLEKAIADLEAGQKTLHSRIPADTLALYEALRKRRQGRAIARIERNSCGGCRISLPVDTITNVRRGAGLVQCPSCERILYEH